MASTVIARLLDGGWDNGRYLHTFRLHKQANVLPHPIPEVDRDAVAGLNLDKRRFHAAAFWSARTALPIRTVPSRWATIADDWSLPLPGCHPLRGMALPWQ